MNSQQSKFCRTKLCMAAWLMALGLSQSADGGANLVAIGSYDSIPFTRAEGRISASGNEIVYSFADPRLDFGRIVIRSTSQPLSVIRRDLFVGYTGSLLGIDTRTSRPGGGNQNIEVEFWLRIDGSLGGGRKYAWEIQAATTEERLEGGIPAIIPMFWADGQQIASEVNVVTPESADTDRIQRLQVPHGVVELPNFDSQSGAAWIVLKPQRWGQAFGVTYVSFREDDRSLSDGPMSMPVPVRYTPIKSVLESQIAEAFDRSVAALKSMQRPEGSWGEQAGEDQVRLTASVAGALALLQRDTDEVKKAVDWLAAQTPGDNQRWSVLTVAARLGALSVSGRAKDFLMVIRRDVLFLNEAQLPDGGWGERSQVESTGVASIASDHTISTSVLDALVDARYNGVDSDPKVWKNALQYWTDAQSYGGGFSDRTPRFGGVGQATTSGYTALGAAGLLTTVDMAFAMGGRRCGSYTAAAKQLRAVDAALAWLDSGYGVQLRNIASFAQNATNPLLEPWSMVLVGLVSGLSTLNEKDLFRESATDLMRHYDRQTAMFGVRGADGEAFAVAPSPLITAAALATLTVGNAPAVCQRIVVGDDDKGWAQYRSDASHLARYLSSRRNSVFNWRRTGIDDDVRKLVDVPILLLTVVGPFEWTDEQWGKLREYCLAGGSVVVDIGPEVEAQRAEIVSDIERAFPEYKLADLPADAPVLNVDDSKVELAGVKALGNGFRHFLFLPPESWSCRWHTYDLDGAPNAFAFMDNLLTYATDGYPPRSAFAGSTYAVAAASSKKMRASRLQVGGQVPAHPELIETMSRLMQSNYRLEVAPTQAPADTDLIWLNVAGEPSSGDDAFAAAVEAIRSGKFVLIDVVGGNVQWDEAFRAQLRTADSKIATEQTPRTSPIFTGMIPGTQGFDAVEVHFRKAMHNRFSTSGRCDLYTITYDGKPVGIYSAHDLSSGIGYHFFPGCRGPMPDEARKIAMNAFLLAYAKTLNGGSTQ